MMLFDHLVEPGDPVVVEAPSYDRTLLALEARGAELFAVPLEADGIDVGALEAALAAGLRAELVHIIPNFHNPAGCTLSQDKRERLLAARRRARVLDLRGRPVSRVRFEGEDLPTMLSRDTAEHRRVRELVLEDDRARRPGRLPDRPRGPDRRDHQGGGQHLHLAEHARRRRSSASSAAPARSSARSTTRQARAARAPRRGRRGPRRSTSATRRASCCPRAATSCGSSWREDVDTTALLTAAAERGVTFVAGSDFMLEGGTNALRLAYSAVTPEQATEGTRRLGEALEAIKQPA